MREFLPEYGSMPVGNKHRPLFRLFDGERWRQVFRDKKPVICNSSAEAIRVAKDHVKGIINGPIRAEQAKEPEELTALGDVAEWRRQKTESLEVEREKVFGDRSTVFAKGGKQIPVERRQRRGK